MAALRFLSLFFLLPFALAEAAAPSGETWFTLATPHFRLHHTAPLATYARSLAHTLEWALPQIERRLSWHAPTPVDIVVMDNSDSANGFAANFPNTHIEVFASPFASDSPLSYYIDWPNELASHELTHIVANDTTLGFYRFLRSIFGSWVKPNGLQPTWLSEGLATYEESSLTGGGRGRSPFTDAILRVAVRAGKLTSRDYTSIDRFNDNAPWWPGGNTAYLMGYTIQGLAAHGNADLPGLVSHENAGIILFSPNRALDHVQPGHNWYETWANAPGILGARYEAKTGEDLKCHLSSGGRYTGGQAVSSDGWVYFSEDDWDYGNHLSRVRADAPCGQAKVERLWYKRYSGPTQVAVSESGRLVAFSAFDQDFESLYSDIHIWDRDHDHTRSLTHRARGRDPAFVEGETLVYVRANPDTSETIVRHELATDAETALFTSKPLERISGLHGRGRLLAFSLHDNHGHEKIHTLPSTGGQPAMLLPLGNEREFERNPFLAADGSLYFAAAYGSGPQEIYRFDPAHHKAERVLASSSGYLDRPVLLGDGRSLLAQDYGLNGLNLVRTPLAYPTAIPARAPDKDLHDFLTGEAPPAPFEPKGELPPSVPYSSTSTPATSLWPQYWLPLVDFATDGALLGASTSGNDPLEYHRYFVSVQGDTRANFPSYRVYYHNRVHTTGFHFEASQNNHYFASTRSSNRDARYSAEAISPIGDFLLAYGGAYQERSLFGLRTHNVLFFENLAYDRSGQTPSAIAPNYGQAVDLFAAAYPTTSRERIFADLRPQLLLFFPGIFPSHSVKLSGNLGVTTNKLLASNYYLGGGPSPLSSSSYIVRGYPTDTLFGQRISTASFSYTIPLAYLYRGAGTGPFFVQDLGLRLDADAGSANYLAVYSGKNFAYYEPNQLWKKTIFGLGADFLMDGSALYHVPYTLVTGLHYGTAKHYGGGYVLYLGLSVGLNGAELRHSKY